MYSECRSYSSYEFCKYVECKNLETDPFLFDQRICQVADEVCLFTAKQFNFWLQSNNFVLLTPVDGGE